MSNETPEKSVEDVIAEVNKAFNDLENVPTKAEFSPEEYTTQMGEYKSSKVLSIFKGERRVMGFGLNKALAILACLDEIAEFVAKQDVDS